MNKRFLLFSIAFLFVVSCFSVVVRGQEASGSPVDAIAEQIFQDLLAKKTITSIGVINFSDLDGKATTAGKYIAEEFSNSLAAKGQGIQVIDRNYLNGMVSQNNLFEKGMVPDEVKKLGTMAATGAIATGTVVPLGDSIKVTVKIISTENGAIVTTKQTSIPRTEDINMLLASETPAPTPLAQAAPEGQAPPSTLAPSSETPAPQSKNPPIVVEKGGIHGEISQCTLSAGEQLSCPVIFTNTQKEIITTPICGNKGDDCQAERTFAADRPSVIYGDDGTAYPPVIIIGDKVIKMNFHAHEVTLLPEVPFKIILVAEKVNPKINTATVRIASGSGRRHLQGIIEDFIFKNVPVIRE